MTEEQIIMECWECDKCLTLGDHLVHCSGQFDRETERGQLENDMLGRIIYKKGL